MLELNRSLLHETHRLAGTTQSHESLRQQLTQFAEHLLGMRGHALPQPAPAGFSAVVRSSTQEAVSEKRQILLRGLSLNANAADVATLFAGYLVESIAIAYDSATELPTGLATIDMSTTENAQAAVQHLSEKTILEKKITLELNSDAGLQGLEMAMDFDCYEVEGPVSQREQGLGARSANGGMLRKAAVPMSFQITEAKHEDIDARREVIATSSAPNPLEAREAEDDQELDNHTSKVGSQVSVNSDTTVQQPGLKAYKKMQDQERSRMGLKALVYFQQGNE